LIKTSQSIEKSMYKVINFQMKRKRKANGEVGIKSNSRSPFQEIEAIVMVSLLPQCLEDPGGHIRKSLNGMLMKYNPIFSGVPIAFSEIGLAPGAAHGKIFEEMPHIHFDVKCTALAFCPIPGNKVQGVITQIASTHIGLLVCGIFNASIAAENMDESIVYDTFSNCWKRGEDNLEIGSSLTFSILSLHQAAGMISIEGKLSKKKEKKRKTEKATTRKESKKRKKE